MSDCLTIASVDGFKVSTEKPADPKVALLVAEVVAEHAEKHRSEIEGMMVDLLWSRSVARIPQKSRKMIFL
jgi:hypothetical protein